MIGVSYIDYYIPKEQLSIDQIVNRIQENSLPRSFKSKTEYISFINNFLNVKNIYVENYLSNGEMIGEMLKNAIKDGTINPNEIKLIIYAQEPGYNPKENVAQYIQHKFNLNNSSIVNISGNHCANVQVALDIACSIYCKNKNMNRILIVSSTLKKDEPIDNRIIGSFGILGDAAGIVYLSDRGKRFILEDNVILNNGFFFKANEDDENYLLISKFIQKSLSQLVSRNKLKNDKIEHIVLPNANILMIEQCLYAMGISKNKIFRENISRFGHLDCIDFIVNMKSLFDQIQKDKLNIIAFSNGLAGSFVSSFLSTCEF